VVGVVDPTKLWCSSMSVAPTPRWLLCTAIVPKARGYVCWCRATLREEHDLALASMTLEGMGPSLAVEGSTTAEVLEAYL
jgi:hypothetical protein